MLRVLRVTLHIFVLSGAHRVIDSSLGDELGADDFCSHHAVAAFCDEATLNRVELQFLLLSSQAPFETFLNSIGFQNKDSDLNCAELCRKTIASVPSDCLPPAADVGCRHGSASHGETDVVCDVDVSAKELAESADQTDLPDMSHDVRDAVAVPMLHMYTMDYSRVELVRKVANLFGVFPRDGCMRGGEGDGQAEASSLAENARSAIPEAVDLEVGKTYMVHYKTRGEDGSTEKSDTAGPAEVLEILRDDLDIRVKLSSEGVTQTIPLTWVEAFCQYPKVNDKVRAMVSINGKRYGPLFAIVRENDDLRGWSKLEYGKLGATWQYLTEIVGACRPVRDTEQPANILLNQEPVDLEVGQLVAMHGFTGSLFGAIKGAVPVIGEVTFIDTMDLSVDVKTDKEEKGNVPISFISGVCKPPKPQDKVQSLSRVSGFKVKGPFPATAIEPANYGYFLLDFGELGKMAVPLRFIQGACSPIRPVKQEAMAEEMQRSVDTASSQAQAYVAAALREFNAKRTEKQLERFYGPAALSDVYTTAEILRLLNSIDHVLHNAAYIWPARRCRDRMLGYVMSGRPLTDQGKFPVYLCKRTEEGPMGSLVHVLIHEASHHATAVTKDMCEDGTISGDCEKSYGRSACKDLANNYPDAALSNADSLAYFINDVNDDTDQQEDEDDEKRATDLKKRLAESKQFLNSMEQNEAAVRHSDSWTEGSFSNLAEFRMNMNTSSCFMMFRTALLISFS